MYSKVKIGEFQNNRSEWVSIMRNMEEFCDVTLISENGERVHVHKVVLASTRQYLEICSRTWRVSSYQDEGSCLKVHDSIGRNNIP